MRLCLSCYRLSSSGVAFCGHCGRALGARLCRYRHVSPPGAQFCVQCGSPELSEPTPYLALGCLPAGFSLLGLYLAGKGLWWLAGHLAVPGAGHDLPSPAYLLDRLLSGAIVLVVLWAVLPRPVRRQLARALRSLRWPWRRSTRFVGRTVQRWLGHRLGGSNRRTR